MPCYQRTSMPATASPMPRWGPWLATTATRRMACSAEKRPNLGWRLTKPMVIGDGSGQLLYVSPIETQNLHHLTSFKCGLLCRKAEMTRCTWESLPPVTILHKKINTSVPRENQREVTVTRDCLPSANQTWQWEIPEPNGRDCPASQIDSQLNPKVY